MPALTPTGSPTSSARGPTRWSPAATTPATGPAPGPRQSARPTLEPPAGWWAPATRATTAGATWPGVRTTNPPAHGTNPPGQSPSEDKVLTGDLKKNFTRPLQRKNLQIFLMSTTRNSECFHICRFTMSSISTSFTRFKSSFNTFRTRYFWKDGISYNWQICQNVNMYNYVPRIEIEYMRVFCSSRNLLSQSVGSSLWPQQKLSKLISLSL